MFLKEVLVFIGTVAVLVMAAIMPQVAHSADPWMMNYYGYFDEEPGKPMTRETMMTFSLYNQIQDGEALWSEVHERVQVKKGFYKVSLGSVTPLDLPCGEQYFVGIRVGDASSADSKTGGLSPITSGLLDTMGGGSSLDRRDHLVGILVDCFDPPEASEQELESVADADASVETGILSAKDQEDKGLKEESTETDIAGSFMSEEKSQLSKIFAGLDGVNYHDNGTSLVLSLRADLLWIDKTPKISPAARGTIDKLAGFLNHNSRTKINIAAHTDSIGTYVFNAQLAKQWAVSMKKSLSAEGVAEGRMNIDAVGEGMPVADNGFEWGRKLNRRVELTLTPE